MRIGFLYSLLRKDEKLLLEEVEKRGHTPILFNDRELFFTLHTLSKNQYPADVIIERCISHSRASYSLRIFNEYGFRTINSAETAEICGSKFLVSEALLKAGIPTPKVAIAFNRTQALKAIQTFGYPVILKPAIGSWGTLLAKVNDIDAAQAVLAHKKVLGSFHHSIYYIQKYIHKPGRDIRVFVVGGEVVGAIYRKSDFWITHLDHGAILETCPISDELHDIATETAKAVRGEIVAVDIAEDVQGKLWVLEVDYTIEYSTYSDVLDAKKITESIISYAESIVTKNP